MPTDLNHLNRRIFSSAVIAGGLSHLLTPAIGRAAEAKTYEPQDGENHVGFRKTSITYEGTDGSQRKRDVVIWYPSAVAAQEHNYRGQVGYVTVDAEVAKGKHPLILFSHGFLGSADQSIFLTEGLARRGYIVACCSHADGLLQKRDKPIPPPRFADAKSWNEDKFRDRREDVVALLDHLLDENANAGSAWQGRVDPAAVGMSGHSLGGYTTLGLVGGWAKSTEQRIKAALALSPYTLPYHEQGNIADVKVPVMFQGGTFDWGITPLIPPVYKKLTSPKYYLVLKNETHFGWTNLIALGKLTTEVVRAGNAQLMLDYSAAFFDRHLRGKENGKLLEEQNARLSSYEFAAK
jgi:predicted dienelactone hydrolase